MALFGKKPKKEEAACGCGCGCDSEKTDAARTENTSKSGIKVLGSGCAKCNQLGLSVREALSELGMDPTIEHVTDFAQIAAYGVMTMPALVVDGRVVSFGKVLKKEEVMKILQKVRP